MRGIVFIRSITKCTVFSSLLWAGSLFAQWDGFIDPGYTGSISYSEWDSFSTTTNAIPDVAGTNGTITENGSGFITSTLNIYSYSSNTFFSVEGSSSQDIGQLTLQFLAWGQESSLISQPGLFVNNGSEELGSSSNDIIFQETYSHPSYGSTTFTGFSFYWDLSDVDITSYRIDFELLQHTSLDKVRLDTTNDDPIPVVPVALDASLSANKMVLSFPSHAGNYYQVKWTNDLSASGAIETWNDLGAVINGDGSVKTVEDDTISEDTSRFYALVITN